MTSKTRTFDAETTTFEPFRAAGLGIQQVKTWVSSRDGHPCTIGLGELRNIRIADYEFGFSDFLFVTSGSVRITANGRQHHLRPGQAIFIPQGEVVTIEVPDHLQWLYVTHPANWNDLTTSPASVTEYFGGGSVAKGSRK